MTSHPHVRKYFFVGSLLLGLGVLIGAFGAHGLKSLVSPEKLITFETGVRYHFYHAFGILLLSFAKPVFPNLKTEFTFHAFLVGILLFSFNCYFYVISGLKFFAMIVPVGGTLMAIGWLVLAYRSLKS